MSTQRLVLSALLVAALLAPNAAASLARPPAAPASMLIVENAGQWPYADRLTQSDAEPTMAEPLASTEAMLLSAPGDENWAAGYHPRGLDGNVYALAVDRAKAAVYAGGHFWTAGGASVDYVAKWDAPTSSWSLLVDGNELNDGLYALVFDDTGRALYAAGRFTSAGGVSATHIARWDVALGTWSPLGGGLYGNYPPFPVTLALDDTGSTVYAGGNFAMADGVRANRIARWDQSTASWSALGSGMNDRVLALAWDSKSSVLYAAGEFTTAGGVSANRIAKWDGVAWSPLGSGTEFPVYALALDDAGNLYAGGGGWYDSSGESPTDHLAKWDGENWSSLGNMDGSVRALAWDSAGATLYAGGWFTTVDGISANHIAKWNGAAWSPLGSGLMYEGVATLALDSSRSHVYVAGWFGWAGGVSVTRTAVWNARTSSWSALGSGMNFSVNTLALDGDAQTLYAGGEFTTAGGIPANFIARWRPTIVAPIEQPSAGTFVTAAVTLSGFAIDLTSATGTGIDSIRVYLDGPSGAGALIGQATCGVSRPDIAALYGARFRPSGWELAWDASGIAPGAYRLYLYAHRTTDNTWSVMDPHLVIVAGGPTRWLPLVLRS